MAFVSRERKLNNGKFQVKGHSFYIYLNFGLGFQSVLTKLVLISGISPLALTGLKLLGGLFTIIVMMLVLVDSCLKARNYWQKAGPIIKIFNNI